MYSILALLNCNMEVTRECADRRLSAHASNLHISSNGRNFYHREYGRRCDSTTSVLSLKVIPPEKIWHPVHRTICVHQHKAMKLSLRDAIAERQSCWACG